MFREVVIPAALGCQLDENGYSVLLRGGCVRIDEDQDTEATTLAWNRTSTCEIGIS